MKAYLNSFKYKSVSTDEWKKFLLDFFPNKTEELKKVEWEKWFKSPGMPPVVPR